MLSQARQRSERGVLRSCTGRDLHLRQGLGRGKVRDHVAPPFSLRLLWRAWMHDRYDPFSCPIWSIFSSNVVDVYGVCGGEVAREGRFGVARGTGREREISHVYIRHTCKGIPCTHTLGSRVIIKKRLQALALVRLLSDSIQSRPSPLPPSCSHTTVANVERPADSSGSISSRSSAYAPACTSHPGASERSMRERDASLLPSFCLSGLGFDLFPVE
jgi:hypothetical protein